MQKSPIEDDALLQNAAVLNFEITKRCCSKSRRYIHIIIWLPNDTVSGSMLLPSSSFSDFPQLRSLSFSSNSRSAMLLKIRLWSFRVGIPAPSSSSSLKLQPFRLKLQPTMSSSAAQNPSLAAMSNESKLAVSEGNKFVKKFLFVPPGVEPEDVTEKMVLPGSNIVIGPYTGHSQIKEIEFVKSSNRAKDCPKDERPEFAILGRSNVGKSSLINTLVKRKEVALTSKKPGKTQLINHFLVNKSWYIVDLPGYGFATASESERMDWSAFTKGYFLNRESLVAVLLLIDATIPPKRIDIDCANWLGRNNIPMTIVFTKCDKMKGKGKRPEKTIGAFQDFMKENYKQHPPWIMTSSVSGLGRDELLLHMSQLRNYWDQ